MCRLSYISLVVDWPGQLYMCERRIAYDFLNRNVTARAFQNSSFQQDIYISIRFVFNPHESELNSALTVFDVIRALAA
jgi:hypothetical protein